MSEYEVTKVNLPKFPTPQLIVLTVEEAKELANKLKGNGEFYFLQTGNFDYDTEDLYQCLLEKIEQVEKKDESR